jgi:hypothetical protein
MLVARDFSPVKMPPPRQRPVGTQQSRWPRVASLRDASAGVVIILPTFRPYGTKGTAVFRHADLFLGVP